MEHLLNSRLLHRRINIHLVGAGGNGAQVASKLARLDIAMRALGHPHGLHVTAFDPGIVREANVGRQVFSPSDIGLHKAIVTIHRINMHYQFDWDAYPWTIQQHWERHRFAQAPDILIGCVDTRTARREIHEMLSQLDDPLTYWLDLGNSEHDGQVVLGQPCACAWYDRAGPNPYRLPTVTELFPELLDRSIPEDDTPSCSVQLSLASQGLFVNDVAATYAVALLYELFAKGRLREHGMIFDLQTKVCSPLVISPKIWVRFGLTMPPAAVAAD